MRVNRKMEKIAEGVHKMKGDNLEGFIEFNIIALMEEYKDVYGAMIVPINVEMYTTTNGETKYKLGNLGVFLDRNYEPVKGKLSDMIANAFGDDEPSVTKITESLIVYPYYDDQSLKELRETIISIRNYVDEHSIDKKYAVSCLIYNDFKRKEMEWKALIRNDRIYDVTIVKHGSAPLNINTTHLLYTAPFQLANKLHGGGATLMCTSNKFGRNRYLVLTGLAHDGKTKIVDRDSIMKNNMTEEKAQAIHDLLIDYKNKGLPVVLTEEFAKREGFRESLWLAEYLEAKFDDLKFEHLVNPEYIEGEGYDYGEFLFPYAELDHKEYVSARTNDDKYID